MFPSFGATLSLRIDNRSPRTEMSDLSDAVSGPCQIDCVSSDAERTKKFYASTLGLSILNERPTSVAFGCDDTKDRGPTSLNFHIRPRASPGANGKNQISSIALSVPKGAFDSWERRLIGDGVRLLGRAWAFGDRYLCFTDPDGLMLSIVDDMQCKNYEVGRERRKAIGRVSSIEMSALDCPRTAALLTGPLGFKTGQTAGSVSRYHQATLVIDLVDTPGDAMGRPGPGVISALVWTVKDRATLTAINEALGRHAREADSWTGRLASFASRVRPLRDLPFVFTTDGLRGFDVGS